LNDSLDHGVGRGSAGGFYSTPAGRKDLSDIGNAPLSTFDEPPLEVLKRVGLA
jgi:hypothetical protein